MWILTQSGHAVNIANARELALATYKGNGDDHEEEWYVIVKFDDEVDDDTPVVACVDTEDKAWWVIRNIYIAMTRDIMPGIDMGVFLPSVIASMPAPIVEELDVPELERTGGLSNAANAETLRKQNG